MVEFRVEALYDIHGFDERAFCCESVKVGKAEQGDGNCFIIWLVTSILGKAPARHDN